MTNSDLLIEKITARAVLVPLERPISTAKAVIPAAPLVLVDVVCSGGIVGRAYVFAYTPVSLKPLVAIVDNVAEMLVGMVVAPFDIKKQLDSAFCLLGRQGLLGMALAGLDMALWDALGKSADMSVAQMLGGGHAALPCYESIGFFNPATSLEDFERSLSLGFNAIKFRIGNEELRDDVEAVKMARDFVGPDVKLMVDYNQSLTAPEAIRRLKHLEPFDLHWVEEPLPAEDFAGQAAVRQASNVPIQTGENWWFAEGAANAIAAGVSDHAMLDIVKIGGVSGWLSAAAVADAASMPVSSHIFIEASAHVMAVTPRVHLLEFLDVAGDILEHPSKIKDGKLAPRGPGLGIEWRENAVEKCLV